MDRLPRKPERTSELSQALNDCWSCFLVVFLFSVVTNLLMLAFPIYMLQVYDRVLTTGHTNTLVMLTLIVGGALLLMAGIEGLRSILSLRIGGWLTNRLGGVLLNSSIRSRLSGQPSTSNVISDLSVVRNFISTQGLTFFCDAPWVPIYVAIIWLIHPWLGGVALVAAILLLLLSILNDAATRGLLLQASDSNFRAMRDSDATLRNAEVVMSMGMMPALAGRWQGRHEVVLEYLRRAGERSALIVALTKFIRLFSQVSILGLGALLVIRSEFTAGGMIACSILLGRALAPVEMAMGAWKNFTQARMAFGRLKKQLEDYPTPKRRVSLPPPAGRLSVNGLSYTLNSRRILDDVSFEIEPGDALAIIGPSAAGKSTLCRLLVGLSVSREGEIRIDDSAIEHWNPEELGPHIGFLPQNVELFAGTIKENIARMTCGDDAGVIRAAKLAHAHGMIQRMPDGYDTEIGDGGLGLSGGQRQRIGLARAVFGDPKLVVLDEPNANLDQAGEAALSAAIKELKEANASIVMVGHRPSTLSEATKILLLRDGRVQCFGPRDEVLARMREASLAQQSKSDAARIASAARTA